MSYIKINGIETYYEESGRGIPIVFLHGWSLNLNYWRAQIEYFAQRYRTIAYDWRGMGKSGGGKQPYDFPDLSDDLAVFLKALNIERPVLCGHSQGGNIALQYAIDNSAPISALVVADAPGPRNITTGRCSLALLRMGVAIRSLFPGEPLKPFVPMLRDVFFSEYFQSSNPEAIKAWKEQFLSNSVRCVLNADRAQAYRKDPTPKLSRITAPTLILRGG
jgi:pimeloyl-ACP methyl ester carboxylesterase